MKTRDFLKDKEISVIESRENQNKNTFVNYLQIRIPKTFGIL